MLYIFITGTEIMVLTAALRVGEMKGTMTVTLADHEQHISRHESHDAAVGVTLNTVEKSTAPPARQLTNLYVLTFKKYSTQADP